MNERKKPWSESLLAYFGYVKSDKKMRPRAADQVQDPPQNNPYFTWLKAEIETSGDRLKRYNDYEEMDRDPEVSAVLDTFAEESTQMSVDRNATIWVDSPKETIRAELNSLLAEIEVEDTIVGLVRSMCKFGDCFQRLSYTDEEGVVRMLGRDPKTIRRLEDQDVGILQGFDEADEDKADGVPTWKPWDIIHWRLLSSRRTGDYTYGDSILEDARSLWRRLRILEDSVTLYRIQNAPDRFVFYIDTQLAPPEVQWSILNFWRRRFRKNSWFDPSAGDMRAPHNPQALDEAIFFPVPKDSTSRIEKLQGSANIADISDLQYFRGKLYAAFRLPSGYVGGDSEAGGFNPHLTLAAQDLRVARRAKRIQRATVMGFARLCQIHYALKFEKRISYPRDFRIGMVIVNVEDQMRRMEVAQARIDTATRLRDLTSGIDLNADALKVFILGTILGLTREEILVLTRGGPSTIDVANAAAPGGGEGFPGEAPGFGFGSPGSLGAEKGGAESEPDATTPEGLDTIFRRVGSKLSSDRDFRMRMRDVIQEVQGGDAFGDIYTVGNDTTLPPELSEDDTD